MLFILSPTVKKFSVKLQHRFPRLYEIISQENLTNFKVRDVISQKILKFPVHVSRMKHVQGSRAPLEKYGPFSNPDLQTIPEEAPQNDPPYNADDFNDNWDDIYEENSSKDNALEDNIPPSGRLSPDALFDLDDDVPSSPLKNNSQEDQEYSIFRSLETPPSPKNDFVDDSVEDPHETDVRKYIPHEEIEQILNKKLKDNVVYYRCKFRDSKLGTRYINNKFIDPKLLSKFPNL